MLLPISVLQAGIDVATARLQAYKTIADAKYAGGCRGLGGVCSSFPSSACSPLKCVFACVPQRRRRSRRSGRTPPRSWGQGRSSWRYQVRVQRPRKGFSLQPPPHAAGRLSGSADTRRILYNQTILRLMSKQASAGIFVLLRPPNSLPSPSLPLFTLTPSPAYSRRAASTTSRSARPGSRRASKPRPRNTRSSRCEKRRRSSCSSRHKETHRAPPILTPPTATP